MRWARRVRVLALVTMVVLLLLAPAEARAALTPLPDYLLAPARVLKARQAPRRKSAIRLERNAAVRYWIGEFTTTYRDRFALFLERGAVYKTLIENILVRRGVPAELYYLAMIESGFETDATSWVSAVGLWQFMRPTARLYGLRVDETVDERLDPIRSTEAAARCLRDLHREFGSWYLAMAAYNAGSARIARAVRRGRTRNFWRLAARGFLPRETARYVPQFHAAMAIALRPEAYGFRRHPLLEYPKVRRLRLAADTTIDELAEERGLPAEAVRAVNPQLLRDLDAEAPESGAAAVEIWLPVLKRKPLTIQPDSTKALPVSS